MAFFGSAMCTIHTILITMFSRLFVHHLYYDVPVLVLLAKNKNFISQVNVTFCGIQGQSDIPLKWMKEQEEVGIVK